MSEPTHRPAPLQNRVWPTGEVAAHPARGLFTGNRGILPFTDGRLGTARWKHPHWILCTLTHPRGRYHGPMPARAWTPLFFLDEAVGLAAGHRPCAYCRPEAYRAYTAAWARAQGGWPGHKSADRALHHARVRRDRSQIRHEAALASLPSGAMILWQDQPTLVQADHLRRWTPTGYGSALDRPATGTVTVLTPRPSLACLTRGFAPELHPSHAD